MVDRCRYIRSAGKSKQAAFLNDGELEHFSELAQMPLAIAAIFIHRTTLCATKLLFGLDTYFISSAYCVGFHMSALSANAIHRPDGPCQRS